MKTRMMMSVHHLGKQKPIWVVLSDIASQENCDDYEYDAMNIASDYIKELEDKITNMENLDFPIYQFHR
jgi:hypothetical protein